MSFNFNFFEFWGFHLNLCATYRRTFSTPISKLQYLVSLVKFSIRFKHAKTKFGIADLEFELKIGITCVAENSFSATHFTPYIKFSARKPKIQNPTLSEFTRVKWKCEVEKSNHDFLTEEASLGIFQRRMLMRILCKFKPQAPICDLILL